MPSVCAKQILQFFSEHRSRQHLLRMHTVHIRFSLKEWEEFKQNTCPFQKGGHQALTYHLLKQPYEDQLKVNNTPGFTLKNHLIQDHIK